MENGFSMQSLHRAAWFEAVEMHRKTNTRIYKFICCINLTETIQNIKPKSCRVDNFSKTKLFKFVNKCVALITHCIRRKKAADSSIPIVCITIV